MIKHLHHIVPKHMGGSDDASNLVELTVEEHAEAHRKLWETNGNWQYRLGKKYGPRAPYRKTEKSMNIPNRGQPWSAARRAAQQNKVGA